MNKVVVLGSINLDRTIRVSRMPKGGETIHAEEIFSAGGGKGANQAVAAQRLGAKTAFIGAIGNDDAGKTMLELLENEAINTKAIAKMNNEKTGQAYVIVDDKSENRILVYGGANMAFTTDHVAKYADVIGEKDFIVSQFETSLEPVIEAFKIAHQNQVTTILNPAPAKTEIPSELLALTDVIIPNETETQILTGIEITDIKSMQQAAAKIHAMGIKVVLITIGKQGTFYSYNGQDGIVPAFKVKALDTTAAGDTFIGALSSVLKKDMSNLVEAIKFSNKASSLTVQRLGAQPSIPYLKELQ